MVRESVPNKSGGIPASAQKKNEKSGEKTTCVHVPLISLENRKNYCSFVITSKSILRRGPAYIAETFEGQWPHDPESVGL